MRLATLFVALLLTAGVLWLAGEQHRKNCLSTGNTACSVLPWERGAPPVAAGASGKLTPLGCRALRLQNAAAINTADIHPLPPECR